MNTPGKISESGCRDTTLHTDAKGGRVFLLESGSIGMEYEGRLVVHSIENWIALDFKDLPTKAVKNPCGHRTPGSSTASMCADLIMTGEECPRCALDKSGWA